MSIHIHNRSFDRPRVVNAHGTPMPIEATADEMDGFHVLNNAFKRKLGFVSSLNPLNHGLPMWKHLNRSNPELYSCLDALALLRNHYHNQQQLDATGARTVWNLLHVRLDPVLDHMHNVGMAVDEAKRQELSVQLHKDLEAITQQMNAVVPEAVRSPKVWVNQSNAVKGRATLAARMAAEGDPGAERIANAPIFEVPATKMVTKCSACGEVGIKADHVTRKFLKKVVESMKVSL